MRPGAPRSSGFILVAVLVALVVITLLASAVAVVSERAVREARENAEAFEAEVATASTRDTVMYLLTSQRQTYGGLTVDKQVVWSAGQATASRPTDPEFDDGLPPRLPVGNEIRLDGTPYQGLDGAVFALQDSGGLFSPNWSFELYRPGFFSLLKIPPEKWGDLEAKRLDYQDPDDLVRLNGAEAEQYRKEKMPPPTNRTLTTPLETRRILGWGTALEEYSDAEVMSLITASRSVMINVNTAPRDALQTLPGVDAEKADRIIALRSQLPFMLAWQFLDTFDLPLDEHAPIGFLAIGNGTLKLWHNTGGPIRLVHWTLTPTDEGGRPWRYDYELVIPHDKETDDSTPQTTAAPLLSKRGMAGS